MGNKTDRTKDKPEAIGEPVEGTQPSAKQNPAATQNFAAAKKPVDTKKPANDNGDKIVNIKTTTGYRAFRMPKREPRVVYGKTANGCCKFTESVPVLKNGPTQCDEGHELEIWHGNPYQGKENA